jgi:tyrosyl-tRNA synthetase
MSQTTGNYVGISEPATEMYGKLLSIPDGLTRSYYTYLTDCEVPADLETAPRDAKRRLAREIVTMYHDAEAARAAQDEFDRIHVRHEPPSEIPQVPIDRSLVKADGTIWVVDLLQASGLVNSRGDAKRLIAQGGVRINEERIASADLDVPFDPPLLVQAGKRSFAELV